MIRKDYLKLSAKLARAFPLPPPPPGRIGLNTVQWLIDFKQFGWFGGHRLSTHLLVIDYISKIHGCEAVI